MKPILFKVCGICAWYIWSFKYQDILEGAGCGPFLTEWGCWDAIYKIRTE